MTGPQFWVIYVFGLACGYGLGAWTAANVRRARRRDPRLSPIRDPRSTSRGGTR